MVNENRIELIRNLKEIDFRIGTDGFIRFVDVMGDDSSIVQAARVSYGDGTKSITDDKGLIGYLMRHRHTTPFEMCEVKIIIRIPMDTWRQWIRHRTANVNEYSTRYSKAIDSMAQTKTSDWRLQSETNKQGSSSNLTDWPPGFELKEFFGDLNQGKDRVIKTETEGEYAGELRGFCDVPRGCTPGQFLSMKEKNFQEDCTRLYEERLAFGVAREQARKDLPLSTYTEAYWKCDLHNIFHFLGLRMDSHAQQEIREYATILGEQIIKPLFPWAWEAFVRYRLNAVTLSELDIEALREVLGHVPVPDFGKIGTIEAVAERIIESKRERNEFVEKWKKLVGYHKVEDGQ